MVALPQSAFPKRHAQSNPRRSCVLSRSLTSVQESSDIGLQGKQQAEEKNGMFVSRSHIECVWCETLHFLSYPIFLFSCNARPTLVRRSLTEIRTPSSSAGSSRSRLCRSDWEILQVRGRHASKLSPTNHSQSTSTKSLLSYFPQPIRITHTPTFLFSFHPSYLPLKP